MNMAGTGSLIVFNWKENPPTSREASRLFGVIAKMAQGAGCGHSAIVVCPPFVYLEELSKKSAARHARFSLGAQDVFWEETGAYTSQIGPAMLKQFGAGYAIIGHSERRRLLGETDEMVNKKVSAALAAGLRVVLCVGESPEIRREGTSAVRRYIKNQLKKDLRGIKIHESRSMNHLTVAYEPIWAIGTGRDCPPAEARDMAVFIKQEVSGLFAHRTSLVTSRKIPVLYGGSVDSANIRDYLCYHELNGVLVGGASLRGEEVKKIINYG